MTSSIVPGYAEYFIRDLSTCTLQFCIKLDLYENAFSCVAGVTVHRLLDEVEDLL